MRVIYTSHTAADFIPPVDRHQHHGQRAARRLAQKKRKTSRISVICLVICIAARWLAEGEDLGSICLGHKGWKYYNGLLVSAQISSDRQSRASLPPSPSRGCVFRPRSSALWKQVRRLRVLWNHHEGRSSSPRRSALCPSPSPRGLCCSFSSDLVSFNSYESEEADILSPPAESVDGDADLQPPPCFCKWRNAPTPVGHAK